MTVVFDGLYDIKEFILMIDIYQWCDKEAAWGGLGFNIQDWYLDTDRKEKAIVGESNESKVIKYGGGCIIVTPYYKQLSWLFSVLRDFVEHDRLDSGVFLDGFRSRCEEYFRMSPDHSAKELMVFILEGIQRQNDIKNGYCREKEE